MGHRGFKTILLGGLIAALPCLAETREERALTRAIESYFLEGDPTHQGMAATYGPETAQVFQAAVARSPRLQELWDQAERTVDPLIAEKLKNLKAQKGGLGYSPLEDLKERLIGYTRANRRPTDAKNYTFDRAENTVKGELAPYIPGLDQVLRTDRDLRRQVSNDTLYLTGEPDPLTRNRAPEKPPEDFEKWLRKQLVDIQEKTIQARLAHLSNPTLHVESLSFYLVPRNGDHDLVSYEKPRTSVPDDAEFIEGRDLAKLRPVIEEYETLAGTPRIRARYFEQGDGKQYQLVAAAGIHKQALKFEVGSTPLPLDHEGRIAALSRFDPETAALRAAEKHQLMYQLYELDKVTLLPFHLKSKNPETALGHLRYFRDLHDEDFRKPPVMDGFARMLAARTLEQPNAFSGEHSPDYSPSKPPFSSVLEPVWRNQQANETRSLLGRLESAFFSSWSVDRRKTSTHEERREELAQDEVKRRRAAGLPVDAVHPSPPKNYLNVLSEKTFSNKDASRSVLGRFSPTEAIGKAALSVPLVTGMALTGILAYGGSEALALDGQMAKELASHLSHAVNHFPFAQWAVPALIAAPTALAIFNVARKRERGDAPYRVEIGRDGKQITYLDVPEITDLGKERREIEVPVVTETPGSRVITQAEQVGENGYIPIVRPGGHPLLALTVTRGQRMLVPGTDYQVVYVPSRDAYFIHLLDSNVRSVSYSATVSLHPDPALSPSPEPIPLTDPKALRELANEMKARKMKKLADAHHQSLETGKIKTVNDFVDVSRRHSTYSIFGTHQHTFEMSMDSLEPYENLVDSKGGIHGQCDGENGLGAASLNQVFAKSDPKLRAEVRTGFHVDGSGNASVTGHATTHIYDGDRLRSTVDFTSGRLKPMEVLSLLFNPFRTDRSAPQRLGKETSTHAPSGQATAQVQKDEQRAAENAKTLATRERLELERAEADFQKWLAADGGKLAEAFSKEKRDLLKLVTKHRLEKGHGDEPLVRLAAMMNHMERVLNPAIPTESVRSQALPFLGPDASEVGHRRVELFLALRAGITEEEGRIDEFYEGLLRRGQRVSVQRPYYGPVPQTLPPGTSHPLLSIVQPLSRMAEGVARQLCDANLGRLAKVRREIAAQR